MCLTLLQKIPLRIVFIPFSLPFTEPSVLKIIWTVHWTKIFNSAEYVSAIRNRGSDSKFQSYCYLPYWSKTRSRQFRYNWTAISKVMNKYIYFTFWSKVFCTKYLTGLIFLFCMSVLFSNLEYHTEYRFRFECQFEGKWFSLKL